MRIAAHRAISVSFCVWQHLLSGRLVYIGINAFLSEFGDGTYSSADWLKSTGLSVRKKQIKSFGDLREMVYKAASCSYMLKISKTHFFLGHPVLCALLLP